MFRSNVPPQEDAVHQAATASFEEGTVKSDNGGAFSFFGFNLFEADETLQHDIDEDESVKDEKVSIKNSATDIGEIYDFSVEANDTPTKRAFWPSRTNNTRNVESGNDSTEVSVISKIKGNLSKTLRHIKNVDLHLVERIRSTSRRGTGKAFDTTEDTNYESRDVESISRNFYDDEGRIGDRKCFPSWSPLKKSRTPTSVNVPMNTIPEVMEPIHYAAKFTPVVQKITTAEKHSPSYRPAKNHHQYHHHHSSSNSARTNRHSSSKKYDQRSYVNRAPSKNVRSTTGTYIKPSNYDDNIWDDQSTSSGWFSLESLDAR
jgi:hypothetical protein